ncbi:MAG: CPBP family intramembrane metalloprotease [Phycisphaerales bacterium]|nr:CPBP family intramembrane metalloprotease [Phycisphaerales bacterium]NNM27349.1 CPBP family intramembrane metalloprotease [Phycisphaerales bacterium]
MIDQPAAGTGWGYDDSVMLLLAVVAATAIIARRMTRLSDTPRRPVVFEPPLALTLALIMLVLGPVGATLAARLAGVDLTGGDGERPLAEQTQIALGAYAAQMIVAVAYAARLATATRPIPDRRCSLPASAGSGLSTIIVLWPILSTVGVGLAWLSERVAGAPPDPIAHDLLRTLADASRTKWFWVMSILAITAVPLLEELLYRALVQGGLRRAGASPWLAIFITSVLFAGMHATNTTLPALSLLFLLSLGFGWVYERTGRLTASIVMHAAFNLANLMLAVASSG